MSNISRNDNEFNFVEKYRPQTIDEIVLPESIKSQFRGFVAEGNIPNLLLTGSAGVGKTTAARAMLEEMNSDYHFVNASLKGNIDVLRDEITSFVSSVSFFGGRKYVILDEADYLNPQSFQPAFRSFTEQYSSNAGFILTCNFPDKIIEPLRSRLITIDFKIPKAESGKLASEFLKRLEGILTQEGIEYDKNVLAQIIMVHFPDWRKMLNTIQGYSKRNGKIDNGILCSGSEEIDTLIKFLKAKDFTSCRKFIVESDADFNVLCRSLYNKMYDVVSPNSIPTLVMLLADYGFKHSFSKDPEINTMAMLLEIMSDVEFL